MGQNSPARPRSRNVLTPCSISQVKSRLSEEVLDFVGNLVGSNHSNLFICITSRPEQDINIILNSMTPPSRRVSLHEEGDQMEDINSFVRSFVMDDWAMRRWRAEDKELVVHVLSERAQGM
jgi:hypothetical protein